MSWGLGVRTGRESSHGAAARKSITARCRLPPPPQPTPLTHKDDGSECEVDGRLLVPFKHKGCLISIETILLELSISEVDFGLVFHDIARC